MLSTLWSSTQLYLTTRKWVALGETGLNHHHRHFLQLWFDVLTSIFTKPLLEADTVLETRGHITTVNTHNTWDWWRRHPRSAWILHGCYDLICLLCFVLLSKYLLSKKKFVKYLEGMMVISVYQNFNIQMGFLIFRVCWINRHFFSILLVRKWDQYTHAHKAFFVATQ